MTSQYIRDLRLLEARACSECGGNGTCDDAETAGIGYNIWTCPKCSDVAAV